MKRSWALAAGGLGLVIVWWYWRVAAPITDLGLQYLNYDLYSYYFPTVRFGFDELWRGHVPLWNPYQLAGQPFFANQQHGLLYPLNFLYWVLPYRLAFEWSAILHYVLALVFAAYLGRTLGLSDGASVVMALTFTFGGYLPGLLYLRTWLTGAVWLPLQLALAMHIFRGERRGRSALLLAAALACQYLGGYPMYSLMSGYCIALLALWQSVALARCGSWRDLLYSTVAVAAAPVCAAALSAVQLFPMIEMTWLSPRRLGSLSPLAVPTVYGLSQLRTLFMPLAGPGGRASAYLGAAVIPLALASLFHPRLRSSAAFFLTLAVIGGTLAAGTATPLFNLYLHLPTSTWFRFPGEFVYVTVLGLAVAAGIGADALLRGAAPRHVVIAGGAATLLLLVGLLIRIHPLPMPFAWAGRRTSVLLMAPCLLVLVVAARSQRLAWAVFLGAMWLDLSLAFANHLILPDIEPDRFEPPAALIRFLHESQHEQRAYFDVPSLHPPLAKVGMRHRLFTVSDHESLLSTRYAEYAAWLQNGTRLLPFQPSQGGLFVDPQRKRMRLLDLLGVRFIVTFTRTPFAGELEAAAYPRVFDDEGARVYENPRALPRAFVVGDAQVADPRAMLARMARDDFDALHTALVESEAARLEGGVSRPVQILEYAPERVIIHASGETPGLLVLTDQCYPGWQVTVDDKPSPIYCADYIFRAVRLPPGEHVVRFSYRPQSVRVGLWVSALTLGALVVWAAHLWRQERARPPLPSMGR